MAERWTEPTPSQTTLRAGILCLLSFLVLTLGVTQQYFVGTDRAARSLVHQAHHPSLMSFMEQASFLGGQAGQVAVVAGGVVMLWPRRRRWALALPVVMAGAGVIQLLAKWAIDRPQPNLESWGFPSAHVLSLVVLAGFLAYVSTLGSARQGRRCLAAGVCATVVGTVAYSRMYLDLHFLSDILGGLTAGLAYLFVAIWAMRFVPHLGPALPVTALSRETEGLPVPALEAGPLIVTTGVATMASATRGADPS